MSTMAKLLSEMVLERQRNFTWVLGKERQTLTWNRHKEKERKGDHARF